MSKNLELKKQQVESLYNSLVNSNPNNKEGLNTVIIDYSKLSANEMNELRSQLFEKSSSLKIIKNTLIKFLFNKFNVKDDINLEGQNAVLITSDDFVGSLKTIYEYIKKNSKGKFKVGILEGNLLAEKEVAALAKLPSKETLIGNVVSVFAAPTRNFVSALNEVQLSFVRVLSSISETKK